ncbi:MULTISPECIES: hypothetical protein [Streptomyces]|uniref:hypothetical protein n=1 Tax=Streptomyces TaxID=1883 RepID=UPI001315AFD5|nr:MULTISPECIES: hypothetical protein [Streptomyces]QGZ50550.1 hypothetical protein GPZ77_21205 [Streptomyces sp. QHH-9511]GGT89489.1 hypothetical protein GCM10010272_37940 [Streptomyces lateritius]
MPERQSTDDDNPFAPPPEGQPDQPWQPRRPEGSDDDSPSGSSGTSRGRWSSRQPGRSSDGFGRRPERQGGPEQGQKPGPKWDPTDPAQRRARYALLSGMWAFFFAIFEIQELALLLGALALYWAVSALRAKPKAATAAAPAAGTATTAATVTATKTETASAVGAAAAAAAPARAQRTAAVSGLVAGALALLIVAGSFTLQLVYRDFYTCADDALTHAGQLACNDLLPEPLREPFGVPK